MGSVGDCYDNARRTTPAWLFDTQTQMIHFSNAKLSTKPGQAQKLMRNLN